MPFTSVCTRLYSCSKCSIVDPVWHPDFDPALQIWKLQRLRMLKWAPKEPYGKWVGKLDLDFVLLKCPMFYTISRLLMCCHLSLECLPITIPLPPLRPGKLPYLLGLEVIASFSASTTLIWAFIIGGWNYLLLHSSISLHLELLGMWSASRPSWDFISWHSAGHVIGTMDKSKKEETHNPWSHLWALGWIS